MRALMRSCLFGKEISTRNTLVSRPKNAKVFDRDLRFVGRIPRSHCGPRYGAFLSVVCYGDTNKPRGSRKRPPGWYKVMSSGAHPPRERDVRVLRGQEINRPEGTEGDSEAGIKTVTKKGTVTYADAASEATALRLTPLSEDDSD